MPGDTTDTTDGHRCGVRWQFVARPLPPLEEKTVSTLTAGRDAQALRRAAAPDYFGWLEHTRAAGGCTARSV